MYALAKKTADMNEADQGHQVNPDPRVDEEHKKKDKGEHSHHVSDKNTPIQIDSENGAKKPASDDDEGNRLNERIDPPQQNDGANESTRANAATQLKREAEPDEDDASPPAIPVRSACDPSSAHRTSGLNDASPPPSRDEVSSGLLNDAAPPPSRDEVSVVPIAMMVTDDNANPAEEANREPVVIATRVSPSRKTRLMMCIALAILVLCGTIAGGVFAAVKPPPAPALPFTPKPPSMSPTQETGPPTYTILTQVGQSLIEEKSDFTNNATTTTGPRGVLFFGWCVDLSLNGERLAITSPFLNAVYIYEMVDGDWQRIANIVETDLVDHIALSGDGTVLAIGMPTNNDTVKNGGKIQVYQEVTKGTFEKRGKAIYGMSPGDRIGGFNDDQWFNDDFVVDDDLNQGETLSTESYDSGSMALSENGTILAMGSSIGNYVRVFVLDVGRNEWVLYGDNSVFVGEAEGDKFGTSVDISADGTRIVIGARNNTGEADPSYWVYNGHARVFQYMQETRTWIKLGQDLDGTKGDEFRGEQAGSSVSMSSDGSTISVAANLEASSEDIYDVGKNDGYVIVYSYDESLQEWFRQGNIINVHQFGLSEFTLDDNNENVNGLVVGLNSEKFPINARLSGDGRRVLLSVLAESLNDVTGRGVVRLYELRGEKWEVVADPIEGTAPYDHSGRSIALSYNGTRIAFGAPQHNRNSPDDGQVIVFDTERRTGDPPTETPSTAPSAMPTRSTMVSITLLLSGENLGEPESLGEGYYLTLECGSVLVTNETVSVSENSTSARNISKTWQVRDGSICECRVDGPYDLDYAVFYGDSAESPVIVTGTGDQQFAFAVTENPASITVLIQGDAHAEEISWILQCGHVAFAEEKLDGYKVPYEISSVTIMGIADGMECEFTVKDSFGDGLCCSEGQGQGFYRVYYGDGFSTATSLLAQGGDFTSEERSVFVASSIPTPAPVATPASSELPITVVIQLTSSSNERSSAISLLCDNELIGVFGNFDDLDDYLDDYLYEPPNITQTYYVNDGSLCHLGVQMAWYSLYLGETDANGVIILEGAAFVGNSEGSEQVSFTVGPVRPSLAITLSILLYDGYGSSDTGWSLVCNGNFLVSYQAAFPYGNETVTTTSLVAVDASCIFTIEGDDEDGEGFYRLYVGESVANGTLFAEGGVFDSTETVSFEVQQDQVVVIGV